MIRSFDEVGQNTTNALFLIDIDDTTLCYERSYYDFTAEVRRCNPMWADDACRTAACTLYMEYIRNNKPRHTDFSGFCRLLNRSKQTNSCVMFLTARHKLSEAHTARDFGLIGLDYNHFKVHYTNNEITKGEYILKHIDMTRYDEVVFVDNDADFIKSVETVCPHIKCYQFNCR